jgi:predicted amidohydrolase
MKDLRLALIQQSSPLGRKEKNLDAAESWARKAAAKDAHLVCFPELNITGHGGDPLMIRGAEAVPDGPAFLRLAELARDLSIFICAGIAEAERGAVYNTQFVVGPGGFVGKQRKVHLSRDEYFYFRAGSTLDVLELPFARVGIAICFDNEIPEVSRTLAVSGAEVLLCPHAARFGKWPKDAAGRRKAVRDRKNHWKTQHPVRARDNGAYVALCDAVGRSAIGLNGCMANHAGGCMAFGPDGKLIAESRARDIVEEMLVVDLKAESLEKVRCSSCFNLRVRRIEAFAPLTQPTR